MITRTLGDPTPEEVSWASDGAQRELLNVCSAPAFSSLAADARKELLDAMLSEACPVAAPGSAELRLMRALLEFDPSARPAADAALTFNYFDELAPAEQPVITPAPDKAAIDAAFAFERETLGANELRILLANDLFRMVLEDKNTPRQPTLKNLPVGGGAGDVQDAMPPKAAPATLQE